MINKRNNKIYQWKEGKDHKTGLRNGIFTANKKKVIMILPNNYSKIEISSGFGLLWLLFLNWYQSYAAIIGYGKNVIMQEYN